MKEKKKNVESVLRRQKKRRSRKGEKKKKTLAKEIVDEISSDASGQSSGASAGPLCPAILDPISGIIDDKPNVLAEWVEGREDLLPSDMQRTVSEKNERYRLALNHLAAKSVCSMSETQRFIHTCGQYLFRPERLNAMSDSEVANMMMTAVAMFDKEASFAMKVAELNKDLQATPDRRSKLVEMVENLPRDVLETMIAQIKGTGGRK